MAAATVFTAMLVYHQSSDSSVLGVNGVNHTRRVTRVLLAASFDCQFDTTIIISPGFMAVVCGLVVALESKVVVAMLLCSMAPHLCFGHGDSINV